MPAEVGAVLGAKAGSSTVELAGYRPATFRHSKLSPPHGGGVVTRRACASVSSTLSIGLDLGDRSPAGITVAVIADILAHMNERDAQPLHVI